MPKKLRIEYANALYQCAESRKLPPRRVRDGGRGSGVFRGGRGGECDGWVARACLRGYAELLSFRNRNAEGELGRWDALGAEHDLSALNRFRNVRGHLFQGRDDSVK